MRWIGATLLLICVQAAAGQVTLPAELKIQTGRILVIKSTTEKTTVVWWCLEARQGKLDLLPYGTEAHFASPAPGKFLVLAFSDGSSAPAECWVEVEGGTPPVPVPPIDPLVAKLKQAYASDVSFGKVPRTALVYLKSVFEQMPQYVQSAANVGAVFGILNKAIKAEIPVGSMPAMEAAIGGVLAAELPKTASTAMTPELRDRCNVLFHQLAVAIGKLP